MEINKEEASFIIETITLWLDAVQEPINKPEAFFIIEAITLWLNTVQEVVDFIEDRQQLRTLLQKCKCAKALLAKLKEV